MLRINKHSDKNYSLERDLFLRKKEQEKKNLKKFFFMKTFSESQENWTMKKN